MSAPSEMFLARVNERLNRAYDKAVMAGYYIDTRNLRCGARCLREAAQMVDRAAEELDEGVNYLALLRHKVRS